jgi:hypothetical protein
LAPCRSRCSPCRSKAQGNALGLFHWRTPLRGRTRGGVTPTGPSRRWEGQHSGNVPWRIRVVELRVVINLAIAAADGSARPTQRAHRAGWQARTAHAQAKAAPTRPRHPRPTGGGRTEPSGHPAKLNQRDISRAWRVASPPRLSGGRDRRIRADMLTSTAGFRNFSDPTSPKPASASRSSCGARPGPVPATPAMGPSSRSRRRARP